ncbi:uncharacterized protein LOC116027103 [Ipomoea triloba]|uniref:uncharacterized protein LOC116027103 n=1 Tax=Ipomoea triloba TaxID=35885 RepID=UPI00125CDF5C|nr:uncharacterized protein LOC116027103 [Ipomoea triloba]
MIHSHRPDVLGLVEPKVSGSQANVICTKLGFSDWIRVEAVGFSGGIWVFWNNSLHISVIRTYPQFVLLQGQEANQEAWHYAVVYRSLTHNLRRRLWSELSLAKHGITGAWMVAGDFNSVVSQEETNNYSVFSLQRSSDFVDWIQTEGFIDMGFSGPALTWAKGGSSGQTKGARLDRALCNVSWRQRFPKANVTHLPRVSSDHAHLLIRLTDSRGNHGQTGFKFRAAWLTSPQLLEVVHNTWRKDQCLQDNIWRMSVELTKWNREVLGSITHRKNIVLSRLGGIQKSLVKLEKKLTEEYQNILYQEELTWFQRSREEWIVSSDRNTAYYHAAATIRKARNTVTYLKDENGVWIEDVDLLKDHVRQYYMTLFECDGNRRRCND